MFTLLLLFPTEREVSHPSGSALPGRCPTADEESTDSQRGRGSCKVSQPIHRTEFSLKMLSASIILLEMNRKLSIDPLNI